MIGATKTKVGEHKGFDIFFDSSDEKFFVEGYDHHKDGKKTYNSCKTYINNYIKENQLFGSFDIVKIPSTYNTKGIVKAKVVGAHQNGNFLCEYEDGTRFQIGSKWDMQKWCSPEDLEKSDYDANKVAELKEKISKLNGEISKEEDKLPKPCIELFEKARKENEGLWK